MSINRTIQFLPILLLLPSYGTAHDSFLVSKNLTWLSGYVSAYCILSCLRVAVTQLYAGQSAANFLATPLFGSTANGQTPSTFGGFFTFGGLLVLPEALLFGALADWGYSSLSGLLESLEQQKQFESLKLMKKFFRTLAIAAIAFLGVLVAQFTLGREEEIGDGGGGGSAMSSMAWVLEEASPEAIYAFCVFSILLGFWPSENFRTKAFSQQINYDDAELDEIIGESRGIEMAEMEGEE